MTDPLAYRPCHVKTVATTTEDIDRFITGLDPRDRRWEGLQLTQSEDARKWIEDPTRIRGIGPYMNRLAREDPRAVLDVGCYGGYLYDYLVHENTLRFDYHGIDINPAVIQAAKEEHVGMPYCTFTVEDIFNLEHWPKKGWDYVWCSRLLIHLPFFQKAVENLLHVSRKKLYMVLLLGNEDSCRRIKVTHKETGEASTYYYRTVGIETLADALDTVSFEVVDDPRTRYSLVIATP